MTDGEEVEREGSLASEEGSSGSRSVPRRCGGRVGGGCWTCSVGVVQGRAVGRHVVGGDGTGGGIEPQHLEHKLAGWDFHQGLSMR